MARNDKVTSKLETAADSQKKATANEPGTETDSQQPAAKQPRPLTVGLNYRFEGKAGADQLSYAGAFEPYEIESLLDLADHISQGFPWMPAVLDEGKTRANRHSNEAHCLALDIDDAFTIQDAIAHDYSRYCGLIIESDSSKPTHHKFRMVFRLREPITAENGGWELIRAANIYLAEKYDGLADPQCKDAARFFFGAKGRVPSHFDEDAYLPDDFLLHVKVALEKAKEAAAAAREAARKRREDFFAANPHINKGDDRMMARLALLHIPPRIPGSGNYNTCIRVLMALKNGFDTDEAIELAEEWSPAIPGDSWNPERKLTHYISGDEAGSGGAPVQLATLFHIAKAYGFDHGDAKKAAGTASSGEDDLDAASALLDADDADLAGLEPRETEHDLLGNETDFLDSIEIPYSDSTAATAEAITERIENAIADELHGPELDAKLLEIGAELRISPRELRALYEAKQAERDQQELFGSDEALQLIGELIEVKNTDLSLREFVCADLMERLDIYCDHSGLSQVGTLFSILTVAASLAHPNTYLQGDVNIRFNGKPILYTMLIGDPGTSKTHSQGVAIAALHRLQQQAKADYERQLQVYEDELMNWECELAAIPKEARAGWLKGNPAPKPPALRLYYTTNTTTEAIDNVVGVKRDNGFLLSCDELVGALDLDRYSKGKSTARSQMLSGRDAVGSITIRKGEKDPKISANSSYSIIGGIQPDKLAEIMGNFKDADGFWARFLAVGIHHKTATFGGSKRLWHFDLTSEIAEIFEFIDDLGQRTFHLSSEAETLYRAWFDHCEARKMSVHTEKVEKAIYAKIKRFTLDIALTLHLLEVGCKFTGLEPVSVVNARAKTLRKTVTVGPDGEVLAKTEDESDDSSAEGGKAAVWAESIPTTLQKETIAAAIAIARYSINELFMFRAVNAPAEQVSGIHAIAAVELKILEKISIGETVNATQVRKLCRIKAVREASAATIRSHLTTLAKAGRGTVSGKSRNFVFTRIR